LSATSTWHPSRGALSGDGAVVLKEGAVGRARRWPVAMAGLVCLAAVTWWVTNSHVFDLRTLRVSGNVHLSSDQVLSVAALSDRTNILWMSDDEIEQRLEGEPWVRSADVSRTLPSTVTISIRERWPVAIAQGKPPLLVASDGVMLGQAGPLVRLPVIEVPGAVGDRVRLRAPQLTVASALTADLRERVGRITMGPDGSVTLWLRGGVRVLFGTPDSLRSKAAALEGMLSWAARHGVTPRYVDLRVPAAPAIMSVA
jgi:cell division protein FtsQ